MGKQSYSEQWFGIPDARLKLPLAGWARREASAGFQLQSPHLPIASRTRVASLLISHQADRLSCAAFRGCVIFHMSRAAVTRDHLRVRGWISHCCPNPALATQ